MNGQVRPAIGAVAITTLLFGSLYPTVAGISVVTIGAVAAIPLIVGAQVRVWPKLHPVSVLTVLVFGVVALIVWLRPPITDYGHTKFNTFVTLTMLTALAASIIRGPDDLDWFVKIWILSGMILSVFVLTGSADLTGRAVGIDSSNPIWLARAIGSAAIALAWTMRQHRIRPVVALPVGVLLVLATYATGSRGPLIAAILGILIVLVADRKHRGPAVGITITSTAVLGFLIASWPTDTTSRDGLFLADPTNALLNSARPQLWSATETLIHHQPWGVGIGSWADQTGVGAFLYPHDLWLEVTAELGWLPGIGLAALTLTVLVQLWQHASEQPHLALLLALLAAETVSVSVSGDLNARTFYFLLLLGAWFVSQARTATKICAADDINASIVPEIAVEPAEPVTNRRLAPLTLSLAKPDDVGPRRFGPVVPKTKL